MKRPISDDTVIVRRPPAAARARAGSPAAWVGVVLVVLAALGGGAVWWQGRTGPAPVAPPAPAILPTPGPAPVVIAEPIPLAAEAAILDESPAVRTVLRFAPSPAIVVLDFPTLAEQGRMLNRMAAWAEKAGVPHDRLLSDPELEAAIRTGGTTADTYYYGHDYRGSDVLRFFALADRDRIALRPEEEALRLLVRRAQAEPAGFGALISIPRADPANDVTRAVRATILHHELSHGEYFTNPAYAAFVDTIWQSVLSDAERAAFRTYLASEGYDPALDDLMKNEMQAYLMHTANPAFFDPARLGIAPGRLAQIRASFLAGMPPGWLRDATPARAPRRRAPPQRPGRVSSTRSRVATVPPRRRTASIAA